MDDTLQRELNFLGMDDDMVAALALLPMVQVAWADGEIQETERTLIEEIASDRYHLQGDGLQLLHSWLTHPPSDKYLARGRRLLHALNVHRDEDFDLTDVVDLCTTVAKAAGGLFGLRTISPTEAEALGEIAEALHIENAEISLALLAADEEDVDDEATDVRGADEMAKIRDAAQIATPATDRTFRGTVYADLVHHGAEGATNFPVDAHGLSIGRCRANDVQIPFDGGLSRFHCRLAVADDNVYIEDNETTNGTLVNGERVARRRLYGGEQISAGESAFTFLMR